MPWDAQSFKAKHNHGLSGAQAKKAAARANAILAKTGDEGMAIAVANKSAKRKKRAKRAGDEPKVAAELTQRLASHD